MSKSKAPDSFTDDETVRRMKRANALLTDPLMVEAFERVEENTIREWRVANTCAQREACWERMKALEVVRRELHKMVQRGEVVLNK